MKKLFLYVVLLLSFYGLNGQVLIQDAGNKVQPINKNVILEIKSENRGLLVPRLSSEAVQNLTKSDLTAGIIVFDKDTHQLLGWNGAKWINLFGGEYTPKDSQPTTPTNNDEYYKKINKNLTGYDLKTALSELISENYVDNSYSGLWETYKTSDRDKYYEKDNTILDIYSENPSGEDAYEFPDTNKCGTYKNEGDCYNREHIVPQSLFNKKSPMKNDAHFIVPTDGKVNGERSNYPFGEVKKATYTSLNGSKLGASASGKTVFEPIDEFKGDVARMIFYFVTRYEKDLHSFKSGGILKPNDAHQGIADEELKVLKKWNQQDPISQREIDRNEAIYKRQHNRNPFIDHPEWVLQIWGN